MISKTDGTDVYDYIWNDQNQLLGVELNAVAVVSYDYDSASRMLKRDCVAPSACEGGTTTAFKWMGWNLIREEKSGAVTETTTSRRRYAVYLVPAGEVFAFERGGDWYYLHSDGLSSTQLITDESGNQVGRYIYGAWGEELYASESVPGLFDNRFVGGLGCRKDSATGLIYMRHRWYDATLQRFISRDKVRTFNRYEYANSTPNSLVDSNGLFPESPELIKIYGTFYKKWQSKTKVKGNYLTGKGLSTTCAMLYDASEQTGSNEDFLQLLQATFISSSSVRYLPVNTSKMQTRNHYAFAPGTAGWNAMWTDAKDPASDQMHHFVAFAIFGYTKGVGQAEMAADAWDRPQKNTPDIILGRLGAQYGDLLRYREKNCGEDGKWPSVKAYPRHWIKALCDRLANGV